MAMNKKVLSKDAGVLDLVQRRLDNRHDLVFENLLERTKATLPGSHSW